MCVQKTHAPSRCSPPHTHTHTFTHSCSTHTVHTRSDTCTKEYTHKGHTPKCMHAHRHQQCSVKCTAHSLELFRDMTRTLTVHSACQGMWRHFYFPSLFLGTVFLCLAWWVHVSLILTRSHVLVSFAWLSEHCHWTLALGHLYSCSTEKPVLMVAFTAAKKWIFTHCSLYFIHTTGVGKEIQNDIVEVCLEFPLQKKKDISLFFCCRICLFFIILNSSVFYS